MPRVGGQYQTISCSYIHGVTDRHTPTHTCRDRPLPFSLENGGALDLNIRVERESLDRNTSTSRLALAHRERIFPCTPDTRGWGSSGGKKGGRGGQIQSGDAGEVLVLRSARLDVAPVQGVDLVHLGEVIHVGQEHVDLDDVLEASASGLQDGLQVLDALVLDSYVSS